MGAWTAVSRGFGFVRVLVVAAVLGTTYLGNAFQAANSVSNVLFELLAAGALSSVLVPTFVSLLDREDRAAAERLAGGLLGVALLGLGAVALAGVLAAPAIASLLTSGVEVPGVAREQEELVTFLLRFFVPQVVLYGIGAIATAVLHARRRFAVTAAAPIGNTVVMVAALWVFASVAGPDPGLDLSPGSRLLLAAAGTLGVAAFVGVLLVAVRAAGFRLRPRFPRRDPALGRLLRLSVWGVFLHATAGALLAAAIVAGNSVEGGVIAYQVAFVFFLAPYAILAQPIHTAVLPSLSAEAARDDDVAFAASTRWALDRMAVLVVPVTVAACVFAGPAMEVVAFGQAAGAGVGLLTAGLVGLAPGLLPYGAFLLLARAYYARDDSRTPATVAAGCAVVGVAVILGGAPLVDGSARVAVLGVGHSVAYALGALVLGIGLARHTGRSVVPPGLAPAVAVAVPLGLVAWAGLAAVDPSGRATIVLASVAVAVPAGAAYVAGMRVLTGRRIALSAPGGSR